MSVYTAGNAGVQIHPSFEKFVEELRADLEAVEAHLDVTVDANTDDADATMQRWRAEQERALDVGVDANTDDADATMQRWRAEQEADAVSVRVKADDSSTSVAKRKIEGDLESLKKDAQEAGALNLKVLGVAGAAGAISQLLAIADAAAQASHMLGLLPAAGLGLGAGVGAALIGSHGISSVFKDYSAVSAASAQNAIKQRDALDQLAQAQYQVSAAGQQVLTADRQEQQAQQSLNEAYQQSSRSIRDMNLSLKEQKLNVSDAAIAVREAAKNLQQAQFDPTLDADQRQQLINDYKRAVLNWQAAQNKQNDLTKDTARANQLGVEGSKQVVAAKQQVVDGINAEASAAHALQQALVGVRKAQEQIANPQGAQSKLAQDLAKLSPNAKELVADVRSLGPAWTDARIAAQDALTNNMGPAVERLANVQLPVFKQGIVGIDQALNSGLLATITALTTQAAHLQFGEFLGNTSMAFRDVAEAAAPATQAITTLATVGSEFMPQLATDVANAADKFDNLILRTQSTGQLQTWLEGGVRAGGELVQTIEHIGSSLASVFRASNSSGDALKSLDDLSAKMATFLKSAQGQSDLVNFFDQAKATGDKFVPILKDLPGLLKGVTQGTELWANATLPFLRTAADLLSQHPELVQLAIAAYVGFKTVKPAIHGASLAIDMLAKKAGAAGESASGVGKFKAAGQQLLSMLGSPWTVGLAVAGAAVVTFVESAQKGSDAVQRFQEQTQAAVDANTNLQKALQSSGGSLNTGVMDAETQSVKGLRDALAANASDMPGLTDKVTAGLADAWSTLTGGLGKGVLNNFQTRSDVDRASAQVKAAFDQLGLTNDQLAQRITGSKPAFDQVVGQLDAMGKGGQDAASHLQDLRNEWALDSVSVAPVASSIQNLADKNRDAASAIDATTSALERQRQGGLTLEDAQLKVNQALTAMTTGSQQAAGAVIQASGAIDTSTQSGQQLYQLLNQQLMPAWEQLTSAAYRNAIQQGQTSAQAQQTAQQTSDAVRQSAEKQIEEMGYTQAQADELLKHYEPLAGNFNATFTADTSQADNAIGNYEKLLDSVKQKTGDIPGFLQYYAMTQGLPEQYHPQFNPITPAPTSPAVPGVLGQLAPHAAGGRLPSSGPGTSRRDGILGVHAATGMPSALLDGGEWVINGRSSQTYNAELAAINAGRFPKLPGFADGGVTPDQGAASSGGISANIAASREGGLIQYARSLVGQPYVWGQLDCSGLISRLALRADGLDPLSGRMATSNEGDWLGALGWTIGIGGGNGVFSVGWVNDPSMPGGGHTAGTLPDGENIEASGSAGKVLIGPGALGATASLFNQHAYLNMRSAQVNTADGGIGAPGAGTLATPTPTVSTKQVTYPQAPLPAGMTDQQLSIVQDKAAIDSANSQRNAVYADPKSTAQDKQAADIKYLRAQNQLQQALQQQQTGAASLFSAQGAGTALGMGLGTVIGAGIGAAITTGRGQVANAAFGGAWGREYGGKLGGILAGGLLSMLGLDQSVLSSANSWNQAFQEGVAGAAAVGDLNGLGAGAGVGPYAYQPKNLPATVTTMTEQTTPGAGTSSTPTPGTTPTPASGAPSGTAASAAAAHVYDPSGGAQQWLGTVQQVLQATGRNAADAAETVQQIGIESSGDPNAVNDTPDGIAAGTPKGLLQVIKSTFDAYADPKFPGTQFTPTANIAAALDYVDARYGGPSHIWPTSAGYASGGWLRGPGGPRADQIPLWGSDGEFMVNAAAAGDNAAWLEAVNAGAQFQPISLPAGFAPRGGDGATSSINNSMTFGDVYTMNHHDFTRNLDSWSSRQALPYQLVHR